MFYCDLDADAHWDYSPFLDANATTDQRRACLEARNSQGFGSREYPWKNLSYALDQIAMIAPGFSYRGNHNCMPRIVVKCSGTAYYPPICGRYLYSDWTGNDFYCVILDGPNLSFSFSNRVYSSGLVLAGLSIYNGNIHVEADYAYRISFTAVEHENLCGVMYNTRLQVSQTQ